MISIIASQNGGSEPRNRTPPMVAMSVISPRFQAERTPRTVPSERAEAERASHQQERPGQALHQRVPDGHALEDRDAEIAGQDADQIVLELDEKRLVQAELLHDAGDLLGRHRLDDLGAEKRVDRAPRRQPRQQKVDRQRREQGQCVLQRRAQVVHGPAPSGGGEPRSGSPVLRD